MPEKKSSEKESEWVQISIKLLKRAVKEIDDIVKIRQKDTINVVSRNKIIRELIDAGLEKYKR